MYSVYLLEETGSTSGSIWVPVIVLGWFVIMTLVGWQVSRRNPQVEIQSQDTEHSHAGDNPSEFDNH